MVRAVSTDSSLILGVAAKPPLAAEEESIEEGRLQREEVDVSFVVAVV